MNARRAYLLGLAAAALPAAATVPRYGADSFRNGGMRGFGIGRTDRDASVIDQVAALGARVARVFLPLRRRGDDGYTRAGADLDGLQRLFARASARGVGLVVVGDFEGLEQPGFWQRPSLGDDFVAQWRWLARRFGTEPALAGLDLMNEPNPPWPTHDPAEAQAAWRERAERAIAAIRAEGCGAPIVLEPPMGGSALGITGLEPLDDPALVYSVHFYTPHDITHQRVAPGWSRRIPYPAGAEWRLGGWDPKLGVGPIDRARLERELAPVRDFQLRHRVPIYIGEFSCVRYAPPPSAWRYVRDCLEIFASHGWSWSYHDYRGWTGWDAEIDSDDPAATRRSSDAPVMTLLRSAMR